MSITIELPEEAEKSLKRKAQAQGEPVETYVSRVLQRDLEQETAPTAVVEGSLQKAADIILKRMRNVPAEVMEKLPKDGASQHDHYIYGWRKREL